MKSGSCNIFSYLVLEIRLGRLWPFEHTEAIFLQTSWIVINSATATKTKFNFREMILELMFKVDWQSKIIEKTKINGAWVICDPIKWDNIFTIKLRIILNGDFVDQTLYKPKQKCFGWRFVYFLYDIAWKVLGLRWPMSMFLKGSRHTRYCLMIFQW